MSRTSIAQAYPSRSHVAFYTACFLVACGRQHATTPNTPRDSGVLTDSQARPAPEPTSGPDAPPSTYPSWPSPEPPEPECMRTALTQIARGACAGMDRDQAQRELDSVLD